MKFKNKKSQFALEYALLIVVAVGSLLAMSLYVQRATQGHLKEQGESMGHEYIPEGLIFRWVETTSKLEIEETSGGGSESSSYSGTVSGGEDGGKILVSPGGSGERTEDGKYSRDELMILCNPYTSPDGYQKCLERGWGWGSQDL